MAGLVVCEAMTIHFTSMLGDRKTTAYQCIDGAILLDSHASSSMTWLIVSMIAVG